VSPDINRNIRD